MPNAYNKKYQEIRKFHQYDLDFINYQVLISSDHFIAIVHSHCIPYGLCLNSVLKADQSYVVHHRIAANENL